jgi:dTDP-4-dehydrorhamnose 3,5-epimerase
MYKLSTFYDPVSESGFAFDDPEVGIDWPAEVELIASERDRNAPRLEEIRDSLPFD